MGKRVYFHIDEIARDAVVAANLKRVLAKRGIDLYYGSRALTAFLPWACPFDALIMPALMFIENYLASPGAACPPLIMLPTEGIGGIPDNPQRAALKFIGHRFMAGDSRWANVVSAYCLWGRQQVIGFEKFAPHLVERCHVIGHPRFDARCLAPARPAPPASSSERVRVGLLTRFSTINPFDGRSAMVMARDNRRSVYHHLQQEGSILDVEDIFYTQVQDLRIILDFVERLDPARHELVVRVHPREDRTRWLELMAKFKIPAVMAQWDQPFIHWLNEVDWVVSPPSTSFYDCFIMKKPVICLNAMDSRRQEHVPPVSDDTSRILDYTLRPRGMDELLELVSRKPAGPFEPPPEAMALLAHDANHPDCATSLDVLADVCVRAIETSGWRVPDCARQQAVFEALAWNRMMRSSVRARMTWLSPRTEQGSTFVLSAARRRWIDALAGPE